MRVLIVECEVEYFGRGETFLPKSVRAVIIKSDGCVSIHSDEGNKPLNYMPAGSVLTIVEKRKHSEWLFENKKEHILVKVFNTLADTTYHIPESNVQMRRYRTEKQLQKSLAENPEPILNHYGYSGEDGHVLETFVEYNTQAGAIDLLIHNHTLECTHIVELKRTAMLGAVDQCVRYSAAYVETVEKPVAHYKTTVAIAAYVIKPNTVKQAEKNNVDCIVLTN